MLKSIRQQQRDNPRIGVKRVCADHEISTGTYYNWCRQEGKGSLEPLSRKPKNFGSKIDEKLEGLVSNIWIANRTKSINAIHKHLKYIGHQISYNTVRRIIIEKQIEFSDETDRLKSESDRFESVSPPVTKRYGNI